jgi:hypothetical protein
MKIALLFIINIEITYSFWDRVVSLMTFNLEFKNYEFFFICFSFKVLLWTRIQIRIRSVFNDFVDRDWAKILYPCPDPVLLHKNEYR